MEQKRYPGDILATACIPWTSENRFDEKSFCKLVSELTARGVKQIYLFGTAGEGHMVNGEQFAEIVKVFAECMEEPNLFPMVGIISLSPSETLSRMKTAYDFGIRDFQFSLPAWGILSDEETIDYFHLICDAFPDCRFMHYNNMRCKRMVDPDLYTILCREIPNLCAVKYITNDWLTISQLKKVSLPIQIYFTEPGFAAASAMGFECGFLVSLASSNLSRARKMLEAAKAHNVPEVLMLWEELADIIAGFRKITDSGLTDGAYDKLFCRMLVPGFSQHMLPPYHGQRNADAVFYSLCEFLAKSHPEWMDSALRFSIDERSLL